MVPLSAKYLANSVLPKDSKALISIAMTGFLGYISWFTFKSESSTTLSISSSPDSEVAAKTKLGESNISISKANGIKNLLIYYSYVYPPF